MSHLETHWAWNKMADILHTTFYWMQKLHKFGFKFDWNLFLKVWSTKRWHWLPVRCQATTWTNADQDHQSHIASLGHNESLLLSNYWQIGFHCASQECQNCLRQLWLNSCYVINPITLTFISYVWYYLCQIWLFRNSYFFAWVTKFPSHQVLNLSITMYTINAMQGMSHLW